MYIYLNKRNSTLEEEKGFHNWLNSNTFSYLVEIIELRKGVIIWLNRKGGGLIKHST